MRLLVAAAVGAFVMAPLVAGATATAPISPAKIDATVAHAMAEFKVPGMAVGIVQDGRIVYAKGYGVREYGRSEPVDTASMFQIGSNTKAFTAAALAILVDEGKIGWDDKVTQYLPDFQMSDPYVSREFTIRDLLSHRSGLGEGAGDLMFYPSTDLTRADIIHGLRFLKPVSSFRSEYNYDNLLYMVAGQIIPAVTGQSWDDFVTDRIFKPLHMDGCATGLGRLTDRDDVVTPHVLADGKPTPRKAEDITVIGPAGTINCNIDGMSKWLEVQLGQGTAPDGTKIFSAERSDEMWSMTTIIPLNPAIAAITHTHFTGYGLGWELSDEFGYERIYHTGGVPGTVTWVTMIPELNLGILVFTNQEDGMAMEAVGHQILDAYLGAPKRDMVDMLSAFSKKRAAAAQKVVDEAASAVVGEAHPTLPLEKYAGTYIDPWRGAATITRNKDTLTLKFSHTDGLEGPLTPFSGNIFIVRWNDRSRKADAYVRFTQGFDGEIEGMTMKAVSPATDSSFDFQDLDFRKSQDATP